ncbi:MAG: hypothetical protein HQ504_12475 [Rhodospirillaceae bacterium]|nr:hypothetical protein [Rhodospirillaceae bacterium]
MAATGVGTGVFFLLTGVLPWEYAVELITAPPYWLVNGWTRLALVIIGLFFILVSLRYNVWSKKQIAINDIAEDLSWAISDLLNRQPHPSTQAEITTWESDYNAWCGRVSSKLENRAFFTRADQLHFDRLGFLNPVVMSGQPRYDWLLSQLKLKFDRLRDVINWTQMRRR